MKIIHIAGHTDTDLVAATVAALARAVEPVELQAMGPAAAGNALHAVMQANRGPGPAGLRLSVSARYERLVINGSPQTAIRLPVIARPGEAEIPDTIGDDAGEPTCCSSPRTRPRPRGRRDAGCIGGRLPGPAGHRPEATYAAIKALAIAGRYLAEEAMTLAAEPQPVDVELQGP